ncbi:Ras guanine nucleotide exchange factor [Pelomyxa schiedti]|nr:Ras guanine nucleotide exchange factor [Pelomyxa schiedti]
MTHNKEVFSPLYYSIIDIFIIEENSIVENQVPLSAEVTADPDVSIPTNGTAFQGRMRSCSQGLINLKSVPIHSSNSSSSLLLPVASSHAHPHSHHRHSRHVHSSHSHSHRPHLPSDTTSLPPPSSPAHEPGAESSATSGSATTSDALPSSSSTTNTASTSSVCVETTQTPLVTSPEGVQPMTSPIPSPAYSAAIQARMASRPRSITTDGYSRTSCDMSAPFRSKANKLLGADVSLINLNLPLKAEPKKNSEPLILHPVPSNAEEPIVYENEPNEPPIDWVTQCTKHYPHFEHPDCEENVRWMRVPIELATQLGPGSRDIMIRGGTIYKIIQYLTHPEESDMDFMHSFLICYSAFTTGPELLEILVSRYFLRKPSWMDITIFNDTKQRIRLKVVNLLKTWTSMYQYDFKENMDLIKLASQILSVFAETCKAAIIVLKNLERVRDWVSNPIGDPPPSILLNDHGIISSMLDMHPEEVARQITLLEWDLWSKIRPKEFIGQAWNKQNLKEKLAPNISRMVLESNRRTMWAITEVVRQENLRDRAAILHRLILTADACFHLRNYNAVMEIMSALHNSALHRLKSSWELLPGTTWDLYDKYTQLFDPKGNFQPYRDTLKFAVPPCIPYLGVFLTDVVFVCDGNPNFVPDTTLINFVKYRNLSNVIKAIQQFQMQPHSFTLVPHYMKYLHDSIRFTSDQAYDRSIAVEPTNRPAEPPTPKELEAKRKAVEKHSKEIFSKEDTILLKAKKAARS